MPDLVIKHPSSQGIVMDTTLFFLANPLRGRGKVRSAIRDDGADAASTGGKSGKGEHCSTRFGARTRCSKRTLAEVMDVEGQSAVCGGPSDLAPDPRGNRAAVGLAGVAFLLVTFLWPRKEKLLAPARRMGETPSRPTASRPARQGSVYLPQARSLTGRPGATGKEGRGHPYRPKCRRVQ